MTTLPNADAIARIDGPLDNDARKSRLMVEACRELATFHGRHCTEMASIFRKYQFDPESIQREEDLARIPAIGVTAMKYFLMLSQPEPRATLKLTSSGTRGQKTQVWFDDPSLERVQAMIAGIWQQEGFVAQTPTNYLMFIYDPSDAKDLGIAFTARNQQRFAPVKRELFAIRKNAGAQWEFRKDEVAARLREYAADSAPTRLIGMPSFIFELIEDLKLSGPIKLPPGSFMFTAGGWKAAEDKRVSRETFRTLVHEYLGIATENIRDGYGMAEHSAPYWECRAHRLHIPVYCRVLARDPVSNAVLAPGEIGALELIAPFNTMMPTLAILSTDLGTIDPVPCTCGHNTPTFAIVGRGGLTKHKGCALTASELVKRG